MLRQGPAEAGDDPRRRAAPACCSLAVIALPLPPELAERRGGQAGAAQSQEPRRSDPLRRPQSLPAGARAQPGHRLLADEVPLDWSETGCVNAAHPICPQRRRLDAASWCPPASRRCRCSSSGRRPANMSSPAICSTRQAMARVRGAAARRRRQGLHRRRRGAHDPRRPAARDRPRSCRACPTNGWSTLAKTSGGVHRQGRDRSLAGDDRRGTVPFGERTRGVIQRILIALALLLAPSAGAGAWHEARSANFIVYSDGSEQDARDFAAKLERFHYVLRLYHGICSAAPSPNRLRVFLLPTRRRGRAHGGGQRRRRLLCRRCPRANFSSAPASRDAQQRHPIRAATKPRSMPRASCSTNMPIISCSNIFRPPIRPGIRRASPNSGARPGSCPTTSSRSAGRSIIASSPSRADAGCRLAAAYRAELCRRPRRRPALCGRLAARPLRVREPRAPRASSSAISP